MENAAEALKIAFAVAMFVIALSLSISSFSQATSTVQAITTLRDREAQYSYVQPSENLSRTVGIETVVTSIYKAYETNMEIHFYEKKADGSIKPLYIYNIIESDGTQTPVNRVDLSLKGLNHSDNQQAIQFLNVLIGGVNVQNWTTLKSDYENKLMDGETDIGLYKKYAGNEFEERLGEYVQGSGTSEITKRVITYIKQ